MNHSLKSSFRRAFTYVEMLMVVAVGMVVIGGVYSFWRTSSIIGTKCISMNITEIAAHNVLDRLQRTLQTAYTQPYTIDVNGNPLFGGTTVLNNGAGITGNAAVNSGLAPVVTGSLATITGTGPGISFFRVVGSPYLVSMGTAGIASNATSISFTSDTTAQIVPPAPQDNDWLVAYTTALLTGTSNQVWIHLSGSPTTSSSGSKITYTMVVSGTLFTLSSTGNAPTSLPYQASTTGTGSSVDVSAMLLRATAFLVVNQTDLRYYDSYKVGNATGIAANNSVNVSGTNYVTLTSQLTLSGTTAPYDNFPTCFSVVQFGGRPFVGVNLHVSANNYSTYLQGKGADFFCTYMGVGSLISLKSNP